MNIYAPCCPNPTKAMHYCHVCKGFACPRSAPESGVKIEGGGGWTIICTRCAKETAEALMVQQAAQQYERDYEREDLLPTDPGDAS